MPALRSKSQTIDKGTKLVDFTFVNSKYPSIKIFKRAAGTNTLLPGAKFDVKINGLALGSFVTDDNGEITIYHEDTHNTIGYGRFLNDHNMQHASQWQVEVTEVEPPKGYMLANGTGNTQTLTMNYGEAMKEFNFVNDWYPRVRILKTVYKKVREQSPTFYKN